MARKKKQQQSELVLAKIPRKKFEPEIYPREDGLPKQEGIMDLPEMSKEEKKAFESLLLQGTNNFDYKKQDQLEKEVEIKHLFIQKIQLVKNCKTGGWEFGEIETNKGVFALSPHQQEKIDQEIARGFALYLKQIFESDLKEHLKEEQ